MMKSYKINRWFALSLSLGVLGFCIAFLSYSGTLIAPVPRMFSPPSDFPVISCIIESESGSSLATWYLPAENAQGTIILLHPLRADRRAMITRARLFHAAGFAVVMIDFQAHGESPGRNITFGFREKHDVRAAVEYAHSTNPTHRIGIVGCSLGGAAALLASPLGVDAMVLESVYPTISEAIHDRIGIRLGPLSSVLTPLFLWQLHVRLGIKSEDLRPIDHIAGVECPVLIAGGDQDKHTTIAETKRLYESAWLPRQLVIFRGAAHTDLLASDPELYEQEILTFLTNSVKHGSEVRGVR